MTYIKYGKKLGKVLDIKETFLTNDKALLQERNRVAEIYKKQPLRKNCKICCSDLDGSKKFISHDLNYYICHKCNHINGENEDTEQFSNEIYLNNYGETYKVDEKERYQERVKEIYLPKVEFLLDSLKKEQVDDNTISILDIGAGSGYFVSAGLDKNIKIKGIEISSQQVKYANELIGKDEVECVNANEIKNYLQNTKCNVVSAIGVLEHIINLHEILEVIRTNVNIKYLYFSVPLFSFSCILESINPEFFNRHLGGAHTHIFTNESIDFMANKYGFDIIAKWQFGLDIADFFRFTMLKLNNNNELQTIFKQKFINCMDKMQLVIDENDLGSEVHVLLKKI